MSAPRFVTTFECPQCHAVSEVGHESSHAKLTAPSCGELVTDMQRFPDGGWMRVETWKPHHDKVFVETVVGNPFRKQVDEAAELAEKRLSARRASVDPESLEGVLMAKAGVYGAGA